jgi:hypothetical protein
MRRESPIPDLWGARERSLELRSRCNVGRYRAWFDGVKARCDALVANATPGSDYRDDSPARARAEEAADLSWAWLLTQRSEYGVAARAKLENVAEVTGGWSRQDHAAMYPEDRADLMVSETIKAGATALSILDPILDPEERWYLAEHCCIAPGQIIYEDAAKGCWWADALNSNWTAVLNSALGFAGIVGLEQPDRETAAWIALARKRISEMLELASADAGGVEGPSYWIYCFGSAQDLAVADQTVGDASLLSHRFWVKAAQYLQYFTLPDFAGWINYGDTPYDSMTGSHVFHGIAKHCTDKTAKNLAANLAEDMLEHHPAVTWKNLVHDPGSPPGHDSQTAQPLPRSALFPSVHLASFRSGWDSEDTLLFVRGGSNAWSHMHLDLGSFVVHSCGERLAVDPGPAPYSLDYWHSTVDEVSTRWHNCMVVDGANQRVGAQYAMTNSIEEAGDCYGRMFGHVSGGTIDLLSIDCTTAYGDYLERYVRSFAFLAPGLIAVFDDCRTIPGRFQRNFEWMLHSECPMAVEGNTVVARGEKAELRVHRSIPTDGECKLVDGKTLPKFDDRPLYCASIRPFWHHKWNVSPSDSAYPHWHPNGNTSPLYGNDYRFLNVLEIVPKHQSDAAYEIETRESDQGYVVAMRNATERCVVGFDPDRQGISVDGVTTDAAIVAVRDSLADSKAGVEWAITDSTRLALRGREVFSAQRRSDGTGSV